MNLFVDAREPWRSSNRAGAMVSRSSAHANGCSRLPTNSVGPQPLAAPPQALDGDVALYKAVDDVVDEYLVYKTVDDVVDEYLVYKAGDDVADGHPADGW